MKILQLCIATYVGLTASLSWGLDKNLSQKMTSILNSSGVSKNHVSLYAATPDGQVVFNVDGARKMVPASITKLVTAAAILHTFKPDHQFKTHILHDGQIADGVLNGNLYLRGGGDPAFVSEKMWMLVNDFLRSGIKKVNGNIVADETFFDDEKFDQGRESERNDRAYDAPLSGLSFNWNSTTIYVRPAESKGEKAHVFIDPENDYVVLTNKVTTSDRGTDLSAEKEYRDGHEYVTVSGKIGKDTQEKHIYKNITEPALYAGYNLKGFLKQRGVDVSGKVVKGKTPDNATVASEVLSDRLYQIAASMNKFSNNFVAEMLAKGLAAELTQKQGTMDVAVRKINEFLKSEVGMKDYELVNVSGFTRKNKLSAKQFVDLLSWVHSEFSIAPEFIHSLPVAGVDGTLEKRFKGMAGERKVRAKTGLLNGVVALSGFAAKKTGDEVIFAFIFNGGENEAKVRDLFDNLASQLTK